MRILRKALAAVAAVGAIVGCSSPYNGSPGSSSNGNSSGSSPDGTGTIGIRLTLPDGEVLSSASYTLTNAAGATVQSGMLDLANTQSIEFQLGNVPSGDGYTVTVTSSSDGGTSCSGRAGPFSVLGHATTNVLVIMACYTAGSDGGNVAVTAVPYSCATWNSLSTVGPNKQDTSGSEANVGSSIALTATATGPAPGDLTYHWSSSENIGTFGKDVISGNGTTDTVSFLCTAPGTTTIALVVDDGSVPEGGSCSTALDTTTISVTCDALPTAFDRVDFVVATGSAALTFNSEADVTLVSQSGANQTFPLKPAGQPQDQSRSSQGDPHEDRRGSSRGSAMILTRIGRDPYEDRWRSSRGSVAILTRIGGDPHEDRS